MQSNNGAPNEAVLFLSRHLLFADRLYNNNNKLYSSIFIIFENQNYCIRNCSNVIGKANSDDMLVFFTIDNAWCILLFNKSLGIINIFNFSELSDEALHTILSNKNFTISETILSLFQLTYHRTKMYFDLLKIYNMLDIFSITRKEQNPSLISLLLFLKTAHGLFSHKTHLLMAMNRSQFNYFFDNMSSSEIFCLQSAAAPKENLSMNICFKKNIQFHIKLRNWINKFPEDAQMFELRNIFKENENTIFDSQTTGISFIFDKYPYSEVLVDISTKKNYQVSESSTNSSTVELLSRKIQAFVDLIDIESIEKLERILDFKLDLKTESILSVADIVLLKNYDIGQNVSHNNLSQLSTTFTLLKKIINFLNSKSRGFFLNLKGLDRLFTEILRSSESNNSLLFPLFYNNGIFPVLKFNQVQQKCFEEVNGSLKLKKCAAYKGRGSEYLGNQSEYLLIHLNQYDLFYEMRGITFSRFKKCKRNTQLCNPSLFTSLSKNGLFTNDKQNFEISEKVKSIIERPHQTHNASKPDHSDLVDKSLPQPRQFNSLENIEVDSEIDDIQMLSIKRLSISTVLRETLIRSPKSEQLFEFLRQRKGNFKIFLESLKPYFQEGYVMVNDVSCRNCISKHLDCLRTLPNCFHCFLSGSDCRYGHQSDIFKLYSLIPNKISNNGLKENNKSNFHTENAVSETSIDSSSSHRSKISLTNYTISTNEIIGMPSDASNPKNTDIFSGSSTLLTDTAQLTDTTYQISNSLGSTNLTNYSNRNLHCALKNSIFESTNRSANKTVFQIDSSNLTCFMKSSLFQMLAVIGKTFSSPFPLLPHNWDSICRENGKNTLSFNQIGSLSIAFYYYAYSYLAARVSTENARHIYFSIISRIFFYKLVLAQNKDFVVGLTMLVEIIEKSMDLQTKKSMINENIERKAAFSSVLWELKNITRILEHLAKFLNRISPSIINNIINSVEEHRLIKVVNEYVSMLKYFNERYFNKIRFNFLPATYLDIKRSVSVDNDALLTLIKLIKSGQLLSKYSSMSLFFSQILNHNVFETTAEGFMVLNNHKNLLFCLDKYSPSKVFHFEFIKDQTLTFDSFIGVKDNEYVGLIQTMYKKLNDLNMKARHWGTLNSRQNESPDEEYGNDIPRNSKFGSACNKGGAASIDATETHNNDGDINIHKVSDSMSFAVENIRIAKSNITSSTEFPPGDEHSINNDDVNSCSTSAHGESLRNQAYHEVDINALNESLKYISKDSIKYFGKAANESIKTSNENFSHQKYQHSLTEERDPNHSNPSESEKAYANLARNHVKMSLSVDITNEISPTFQKKSQISANRDHLKKISPSTAEAQSYYNNRFENMNKISKAKNENSSRKNKLRAEISELNHLVQVEKTKFELFQLQKKLEALTEKQFTA